MTIRATAIIALGVLAGAASAQNVPAFNVVELFGITVVPSANGQDFLVSLAPNATITTDQGTGTITMIEGFYLLSDTHSLSGSVQDFQGNGGNWEAVDLPGNHAPYNVLGYSERNPGPGNSIGIHPGESLMFSFTNLSGFSYNFADYGWRLRYDLHAPAAGQFVRAGATNPCPPIPGPAAVVPFLVGGIAALGRRRK